MHSCPATPTGRAAWVFKHGPMVELVYTGGLIDLSFLGEILGMKSLKFGETCKMATPSQALSEGRCREQTGDTLTGYAEGKGVLQTTNRYFLAAKVVVV